MSDKLEQIEKLSRLSDEGRITSEEYAELKAEILSENAHLDEEGIASVGREVRSSESDKDAARTASSAVERQTTPTIYKTALGAGIASIFLGGTFGLLAWATAAIGVVALVSERSERRRWMAWTGLALGVLFTFMNLYLNGHLNSLFTVSPETGIAKELPVDPSASLGGNKYAFIANYVGGADPRFDLQIPAEQSPLGDAEIYRFEDGSGLWISPSAGNPMESILMTYYPSSTAFDDFLARWDRLCWSLPIDLLLRGQCQQETTAGLGVSAEPNQTFWGQPYEAEYIYADMCWQFQVLGLAESENWGQLVVDAPGSSTSACRR